MEGFDFLMIGYFRSANYNFIKNGAEQFKDFMDEHTTLDYYLNKVPVFGEESEGVELYSLADLFKVPLSIYCVKKDSINPIHYFERKENSQYYLFFRPGHYDIIYPTRTSKPSRSPLKYSTTPLPKPSSVERVEKADRVANSQSAFSF